MGNEAERIARIEALLREMLPDLCTKCGRRLEWEPNSELDPCFNSHHEAAYAFLRGH